MIALLEPLKNGDSNIVQKYQDAIAFWDEFFAENRDLPVDDLAKKLSTAQLGLEHRLGMDRYLGKSLMPTTMLHSLYDEDNGFGDNEELARRALEAIEISGCSIEVKGTALKVAKTLFHLDS